MHAHTKSVDNDNAGNDVVTKTSGVTEDSKNIRMKKHWKKEEKY